MNCFKKFKKFIEKISEKDKVAIIHHADSDGLSSAVITASCIKKLKNKNISLRLNPPRGEIGITKENLKDLKKNKINKIIILDLAVDTTPGEFEKLKKFSDILIIDHHPKNKKFKDKRTTIIKAEDISNEPFKYPASLMCYYLFSKINPKITKELDWVALIGIIGDCAFDKQKKFVEKVYKKYNIKTKKDLFDSELGRITKGIDNSRYNQKEMQKHFIRLLNAKSFKDVKYLTKYNQIIEKEVKKWVKNFKKRSEHYPDLDMHLYFINPKYPLASIISTKISFSMPSQTIIVFSEIENGKRININLRRQDKKIKLNELAHFCVNGLKNSESGGHVVASGARILKKDLNLFKKRIFEYLKKINYNVNKSKQ